jgi:hypothetical protein
MKKLIFRLPLLLLVVMFSCTEDGPTHMDSFSAIYGKVVDTQGKSVAGAKVRVIFDIPNETSGSSGEVDAWKMYNEPNPFDRETRISFPVYQQGSGTLEIFRYPDVSNPVATLFKDNVMQAGMYSIVFDAVNHTDPVSTETLPNGFYLARLQIGDSVFTHKMFHQSSLTSSGTWVTTDTQGNFVLDYKCFPENGEQIPRINDRGIISGNVTLNDSATIYIVKPNFGYTIQKMKIEKTLMVEKTFTIQ